ncbi:MAG: class I SAM-dependent methyltransferase, partial [Prochlorotrichaceae cyanobacterium]
MKDWTQGYIADLDYDYNFFAELAPIQIAFNLLDAQLLPPTLEQFNYCELGCGQGFTTNVLAAANPQGKFWGIDFNPSHIATAQQLAKAAQLTNIQFSDHSFSELVAVETPKFDFIVLHGIYSWVNPENRQAILQFIRQRLNVGGAVYISYNALPGWCSLMPLRELMLQSTAGSPDSTLEKVEKGLA